MSATRSIIGVGPCVVALVAGFTMGLAMGGYGICATSFSPGLVGFLAVLGAIFGGTMALVWRKAWWWGALSFSAPSLIGGAIGLTTGEWQRLMGIAICIGAAFCSAFMVRYPSPGSLKQ